MWPDLHYLPAHGFACDPTGSKQAERSEVAMLDPGNPADLRTWRPVTRMPVLSEADLARAAGELPGGTLYSS